MVRIVKALERKGYEKMFELGGVIRYSKQMGDTLYSIHIRKCRGFYNIVTFQWDDKTPIVKKFETNVCGYKEVVHWIYANL